MAKQNTPQGPVTEPANPAVPAVQPAAGRPTGRKPLPEKLAAAPEAADPVASARQPEEQKWLDESEKAWQERREREEAQAAREQQGERTVDLRAVDSYLTTSDGTGESLLVAQANPSGQNRPAGQKPEDDDDKGLIWLLLGGGLAAAAGGGGGGGGGAVAPAQVVNNGFVFDGYVRNAVVFRDSDGDGRWDDLNGDGVWQQGDEHIMATDATGQFVGLGGTGRIISTSMARLESVNSTGGITKYTVDMQIVGTNGQVITGAAIDNDTGLPFTGFFIAPGVAVRTTVEGNTTTNTVLVTGVSTLTAMLLEKRGITNPTEQQIIDAADDVNKLLDTNYDKDSVTNSGDTVDFFLSNGSALVAALIAALAAKAQNENADPFEAIQRALNTLVDLIDSGTSQNDTGYEPDGNTVDLTDPVDLADIFDLTPTEAEGIANITGGAPGASQISIFHESSQGSDEMTNVETLETDGPVGSITVAASGESHDSELEIVPDADTEVELADSNIRVDAAGADSYAELDISNATGSIKKVVGVASGDNAESYTNIDGTDLSIGDNIQARASGNCSDVGIRIGECGDVIIENVPEGIVVEATGECADAWVDISNASGTVSTIDVMARAVEIESEMEEPADWSGDPPMTGNMYASLNLEMDGEILSDINVSSTAYSGAAYANIQSGTRTQTELQSFDLSSYITDTIASGDEISLTLGGVDGPVTITVQASDISTDAYDTLDNIADRLDDELGEDAMVNFSAGEDGKLYLQWYATTDNQPSSSLSINGNTQAANLYLETDGTAAGALNIGGNISVTASGGYGQAWAFIGEDTDLSFTGGNNLTVASTGSNDQTDLYVSNGEGELGDITVTASGDGSDAYASIGSGMKVLRGPYSMQENEYTIGGDVTVSATGEGSDAHLNLAAMALGGGNVTVEGSGECTESTANVYAEGGTVADLTVTAQDSAFAGLDVSYGGSVTGDITVSAGYDSEACADIYGTYGEDGETPVNLAGGDVSVTADGSWADAGLDMQRVQGQLGNVSVTADGMDAWASARVDDGYGYIPFVMISQDSTPYDLAVNGDIDVAANGEDAEAYARFGEDVDVTLGGGSIMVSATGESAEAGLSFANELDGSVDDITVTAAGSGSWAGVNVSGQMENSEDTTGELGVMGDISVSTGEDANCATAELDVNCETEVVGNGGNITVSAAGWDSSANVDIAWAGGEFNTLTVEATADSSQASADLSGESISINTILVEASGDCTDATAHVYAEGGTIGDATVNAQDGAFAGLNLAYSGSITGDISVNAGYDSEACADVYGTYGEDGMNAVTLAGGSLSATANGDWADAGMEIQNAEGEVSDVTVTADGLDAWASVRVDDGGMFQIQQMISQDSTPYDLSVNGDITVAAHGEDASAYATFGEDVDVTLGGGSIMVSATSEDTHAELDFHNELDGSVGDITVSATGSSSWAGVNVSGQMENSDDTTGELGVMGDISVSTGEDANCATAELEVNCETEVVGNGGNITVTAAGWDSNANVDIAWAGGEFNALTVEATGGSSQASADLSGDFSVTSVQVQAGENCATATANLDGVAFGGGDIVATADSADSSAYLDANITGGSVGSIGAWANSDDADATVNIYACEVGEDGMTLSVSGSVGAEANASGASAAVWINDAVVDFTSGEGDISAVVEGEDSYCASADVYIEQASGTVQDIHASVWSNSASASVHVGTGEDAEASTLQIMGDVEATAYGWGAEACADVGNMFSGIGSNATVVFAGEDSDVQSSAWGEDAVAVATVGGAGGTLQDVEADAGWLANADTWVIGSTSGSVDIRDLSPESFALTVMGDVTSYADGYEADARSVLAFSRLDGANASADADGEDASAHTWLLAVDGTMNNISASADGEDAFALVAVGGINEGPLGYLSADVEISGQVTAYADGEDSEALVLLGTGANPVSDGPGSFGEDLNNCIDIPCPGEDSTTITFNGAMLSAVADDDGASAQIIGYNIGGSVSGISVSADADYSYAGVELVGYTIGSGEDSSTLTVDGDINVMASDDNAEAEVSLRDMTVNFTGGDISVMTGSEHSAEASLWVDEASGMLGNITVYAGEDYSTSAHVSIYGGDFSVCGDVNVTAAGEDSHANVMLSGASFDSGDINVASEAYGASAGVYGEDVSGTLGNIDVSASGSGDMCDPSEAGFMVGGDLTVAGNLSVSAVDAYASADAHFDGDTAFEDGTITVQATDYRAVATVQLAGTTTFDGTSISVSVDDTYAYAGLMGEDASGTISGVTVAAMGEDSSADVDIWASSGEDAATLAITGPVNVNANEDSSASLSVYGLDDDIDELNINVSDDAYVYVDLGFDSGIVTDTTISGSATMVDRPSVHIEYSQSMHGGEIVVEGCADVSLYFNDHVADLLNMGSRTGGNVDVGISIADADLNPATGGVQTAIYNAALTVFGWDAMTDDITFYDENGGYTTGNYAENLTPFGSFGLFLAAANSALDGTTDFFFGVAPGTELGSNNRGYLAYDADGDGITMVVEFLNLFDFDASQIGNSVA